MGTYYYITVLQFRVVPWNDSDYISRNEPSVGKIQRKLVPFYTVLHFKTGALESIPHVCRSGLLVLGTGSPPVQRVGRKVDDMFPQSPVDIEILCGQRKNSECSRGRTHHEYS